MKVKLSIEDPYKFALACEACDAGIISSRTYGKKTVVIVSVKSPAALYEIGKLEPFIKLEEGETAINGTEITEAEALKMQDNAAKEIAKETVKPEQLKYQDNVNAKKK